MTHYTKMEVGESCDIWCLLSWSCILCNQFWDRNTWNTLTGSDYSNDNNWKIMSDAEYSISQQIENWTVYKIYTCRDHHSMNLRGNSRRILHASQRGSSQLSLDGSPDSQAGRLSCVSGGQKQLKEAIRLKSTHIRWFCDGKVGSQDRNSSGQKTLKNKLNLKGDNRA
jgi:hypothetical protein